jgi:DNA-nicking Smr family endonuclease
VRKKKLLTPEDKLVWHFVKQSITPLRPVVEMEDIPVSTVLEVKSVPVYALPPVVHSFKPLAPIERGLKQKLSRGLAHPEVKLDLHGMRQEAAYTRLKNFLEQAQYDGVKLAIVVTGKSGEGVLKRLTPMWLGSANFRHLVIGYEEAGRFHGRDGALYVRIRRLI